MHVVEYLAFIHHTTCIDLTWLMRSPLQVLVAASSQNMPVSDYNNFLLTIVKNVKGWYSCLTSTSSILSFDSKPHCTELRSVFLFKDNMDNRRVSEEVCIENGTTRPPKLKFIIFNFENYQRWTEGSGGKKWQKQPKDCLVNSSLYCPKPIWFHGVEYPLHD